VTTLESVFISYSCTLEDNISRRPHDPPSQNLRGRDHQFPRLTPMLTHTHAITHTRTPIRTQAHMHTQLRTHMHALPRTHNLINSAKNIFIYYSVQYFTLKKLNLLGLLFYRVRIIPSSEILGKYRVDLPNG